MKYALGIVLLFIGMSAFADDYGPCYYDGSCNGAACCVAGRCVYCPATPHPTAAELVFSGKALPLDGGITCTPIGGASDSDQCASEAANDHFPYSQWDNNTGVCYGCE